jgi:hypothetical protein
VYVVIEILDIEDACSNKGLFFSWSRTYYV